MSGDTVSNIIAWESGEMSLSDAVEFFASMIKSGLCWQLQGCYGRQAKQFLDAGLIMGDGSINHERLDEWANA